MLEFDRRNLAKEQLIIGRLGLAVIESVEEAFFNSMLMVETVVGRDGNTRRQSPADKVLEIIFKYRGNEEARGDKA